MIRGACFILEPEICSVQRRTVMAFCAPITRI